MPITDQTFYKARAQWLGDMLAQLQAAISDVYVGEDGIFRILFEIEASQLETMSLANQLLIEDMFIQTASFSALRLHGQQYGIALGEGSLSAGTIRFEGDDGTYIPIGTVLVHDPGTGIGILYFQTTDDGTIPAPGDALAPIAAIGTATGISGDYEYRVSFVTAAGETFAGPDSNIISPSNQKVNLTGISLGGPGTIARRIYRQKNGTGDYFRVAEIADNTTTTYTDSMSDAVALTQPVAPVADTSHAVELNAQSLTPGTETNVPPNTITIMSEGPGGITVVSNPGAFTGGGDQEDTESYRQKLLAFIRAPQTGSPEDLKVWAEEIQGVDSATIFENDNLGTPTNGHVTVRIAGPNGGIPDATVQQNVLDALNARGLSNITFHVGTFTAVPTAVTVDVTTDGTYTLGDVTAGVQQAIADYINSLPVGGTLYLAGIVDAVFGLAGITDVVVTTPASNQATAATSKRTPGTITVT
jgi:uncharacterized phage protein gp47/JayE